MADVYEIYNNWFRNGLKNTIYKSYKNCSYIELKTDYQDTTKYGDFKFNEGLQDTSSQGARGEGPGRFLPERREWPD